MIKSKPASLNENLQNRPSVRNAVCLASGPEKWMHRWPNVIPCQLSCLNVYIKVNKQLALTVDWSVLDCSLCGAFCCDAVLLPCCGPSTQVKQLDIITLLVLFCRTPRVRARKGFFFVVVEVVRILGLSSKGFKYFSSRASETHQTIYFPNARDPCYPPILQYHKDNHK